MRSTILAHKVAIAVQCRLSSRRLPCKALLPFGDTVLINFLLRRLRTCLPDTPIFILTSTQYEDKLLTSYIDPEFTVFRGSLENVLARYVDFSSLYRVEAIVRVTGDNPFTDPGMITQLINSLSYSQPYNTYAQESVLEGCNSEIFTRQALNELFTSHPSAEDLEHVTTSLRLFNRSRLVYRSRFSSDFVSDYSLTVDTFQDYLRCHRILDYLFDKSILALSISHDDILQVISEIKDFPTGRSHPVGELP